VQVTVLAALFVTELDLTANALLVGSNCCAFFFLKEKKMGKKNGRKERKKDGWGVVN
jgi:hypothetical protein